MLIPFFTFVIFLIVAVILSSAAATQGNKPDKPSYNEARSNSILNEARKRSEKEKELIEQIKQTPTELKPKPIDPLPIDQTYFDQTNFLKRGL